MKISVVGCGYLGAVHAAAMAKLGHDVIGIDVDASKIADLQASKAPFFEPGLPELLSEAQKSGSLSFSTNMADAADADVHFLCVGTPQRKGENAADLKYVDAGFASITQHIKPGALIAGKSTVPVGTAERLADKLRDIQPEAILAWNPEFLREGHAVKDTLAPDRLIYGVSDDSQGARAIELLDEVYRQILDADTPRLTMGYATAELVKTSANSFLATKISFINAMAEICEATGADVKVLADSIGLDDRIGRKFLNAGVGFGGGCLPKDIRAFMARAGELGADQALTFLREVDAINMRRRERVVELVREELGGSLLGQRITVLGAAFKPNSDDVRDSPALSVSAQLQLLGAIVTVTDPEALSNARKRFPELQYEQDLTEAIKGAEALILLTEWEDYTEADPVAWSQIVSRPLILDGRNVLDIDKWRAAGWHVKAMGRP
ncbi:UDP-glucose/GDP-mannose dehydrogenase family protein [Paeniglutamicibacter sp. ABSL32-1]|uniref:UDP-glucose dehydrogenase family protein n=1 Tax=Paeniglutamicibacter quisquiliarum TaxID=2849498 RepID=UPI001C2DA89D|nr:UDP-glucose/GDP-mannose dehydrogenase family protein [Paeniglutamicibacter quisquiliarum]MBV1780713.1 UDP-glucose/GDP-mannose dehydrogenase family protein [Paeniglutamicibacter quisquiliarum]